MATLKINASETVTVQVTNLEDACKHCRDAFEPWMEDTDHLMMYPETGWICVGNELGECMDFPTAIYTE